MYSHFPRRRSRETCMVRDIEAATRHEDEVDSERQRHKRALANQHHMERPVEKSRDVELVARGRAQESSLRRCAGGAKALKDSAGLHCVDTGVSGEGQRALIRDEVVEREEDAEKRSGK